MALQEQQLQSFVTSKGARAQKRPFDLPPITVASTPSYRPLPSTPTAKRAHDMFEQLEATPTNAKRTRIGYDRDENVDTTPMPAERPVCRTLSFSGAERAVLPAQPTSSDSGHLSEQPRSTPLSDVSNNPLEASHAGPDNSLPTPALLHSTPVSGSVNPVVDESLSLIPATTRAAWPLKYVCFMHRGFCEVDRLSGNLTEKFPSLFPGITTKYHKTSWSAAIKVWKTVSNQDPSMLSRFVEAGTSDLGLWNDFVQASKALPDATAINSHNKISTSAHPLPIPTPIILPTAAGVPLIHATEASVPPTVPIDEAMASQLKSPVLPRSDVSATFDATHTRVCPHSCGKPWPHNPSNTLLTMHSDRPKGMPLPIYIRSVCQRHHAEYQYEAQSPDHKWPLHTDFDLLVARTQSLRTQLDPIWMAPIESDFYIHYSQHLDIDIPIETSSEAYSVG